jgi:hypothetical protein
MAEILRRTLRLYDNEEGREIKKTLDNIVNTGKGANERLVEDIYFAELFRKYYSMPLREVLVMLTSDRFNEIVMMQQVQEGPKKIKQTSIDVNKTLLMLEKL